MTRSAGLPRFILGAVLLILWFLNVSPALGAPDGRLDEPVRVSAVRYSPDGKQLAIGFGERKGAGGVLVLDAQNFKRLHSLSEETGISSIAYSPNGKWLAYTFFSQGPRLLSTADYRQQARLPDDRRGPVSFSPDSRLLAMADTDNSVTLYDVEEKADASKLKDSTTNITLALFSNDGKRLVAGGNAGGTLWDVESRQPLHRFKHGGSIVTSGAFSLDDSQFLTAGWDGTIRIWSAADAAPMGRIAMPVDRIDLSHSAQLLAVAASRPAIQVFGYPFGPLSDAQRNQMTKIVADWESDAYEVREQATRQALELGWPAASRLQELSKSAPSAEVRVRARDVLKQLRNQSKFTLQGHWNRPTAVTFAPDGNQLASASQDGTVRIWDTKNGHELNVLRPLEIAADRD